MRVYIMICTLSLWSSRTPTERRTYRLDFFEPLLHLAFCLAQKHVPECCNLRTHARRTARVHGNMHGTHILHKRAAPKLVARARGKRGAEPGHEPPRAWGDDARRYASTICEPVRKID